MKKCLLLLAFALIFSMYGCTVESPEPPSAPATEPTVEPTIEPTTEPTAEPTKPAPEPVLNWELPEYPQLSYDEYFGETRYYYYIEQGNDSPEQLYFWGGWDNGADECEVFIRNGKIFAGSEGGYVHVGTETYENTKVVFCDEFWIYAIKDRKELFRIDYKGENCQTLYIDETEKIMASEHNTHVRDNSVLFFVAAAGSDYGIYRLYLPDMTQDLLYTTDAKPDLYAPYSNFEITWSSPVKEVVDRVYEIDYYYNCLTGKLLEKPVYGDRSWGNLTWPWWEDVLMAELYELPGKAYTEVGSYTELFADPAKKDDYNWYNLLLFAGGVYNFNTPAEIDLSVLFNNGFQQFYNVTITPEEKAFLEQNKNNIGADFVKLPTELMDAVLLEYTGFSLNQTNGVGLDSMLYYEPTDSYFMDPRGAAGATGIEVLCAATEDQGHTIHMVCTADGKYLRLKLLQEVVGEDENMKTYYYVQACYEIEPRS